MAGFDISLLQTQLSIASAGAPNFIPRNSSRFTLANLSAPGPDPQMVVKVIEKNAAGAEVLKYPLDLPPYYFLMGLSDYSRLDWLSIGKLNPKTYIALPMPTSMIDSQGVQYSIEDLGLAMGELFNAGEILAQGPGNFTSENFDQAAQNAKSIAGAALTKAAQAQGAISAAGAAVNEFLTVMLKGPQYAERTFSWKFSPNSEKESESLAEILRRIKNGMSVSIVSSGSAFFGWPMIFSPRFCYVDPDNTNFRDAVFYMRPSVVAGCVTNYAPQGMWSPYTSTRPQSMTLEINFRELEFWKQGDFDKGGPPTATEVGTNIQNLPDDIASKFKQGIQNFDLSAGGGGA